MKIGKPFNQLSKTRLLHVIDHHKRYEDFNSLGLYRGIVEHKRLSLEDKLEVVERAHQHFRKFFQFLQVKAPWTYLEIMNLGKWDEITAGEHEQMKRDIRRNQQRILKKKRIKHRSFGIHSKHNCVETCWVNGLMVRQDSWFAEDKIWFEDDERSWMQRDKSDRRRVERKQIHRLIDQELEAEREAPIFGPFQKETL